MINKGTKCRKCDKEAKVRGLCRLCNQRRYWHEVEKPLRQKYGYKYTKLKKRQQCETEKERLLNNLDNIMSYVMNGCTIRQALERVSVSSTTFYYEAPKEFKLKLKNMKIQTTTKHYYKKGDLLFVRQSTSTFWHLRYFSHIDEHGLVHCFREQQKNGDTHVFDYHAPTPKGLELPKQQ